MRNIVLATPATRTCYTILEAVEFDDKKMTFLSNAEGLKTSSAVIWVPTEIW